MSLTLLTLDPAVTEALVTVSTRAQAYLVGCVAVNYCRQNQGDLVDRTQSTTQLLQVLDQALGLPARGRGDPRWSIRDGVEWLRSRPATCIAALLGYVTSSWPPHRC